MKYLIVISLARNVPSNELLLGLVVWKSEKNRA
jgi:hypothetical protein